MVRFPQTRRRLSTIELKLQQLDSSDPWCVQSGPEIPSLLAIVLEDERQRKLAREKHTIRLSLLQEKSRIEGFLQTLTYPVLTLPVKITSEIFIRCLPEKLVEPNHEIAPLLLTCICRHWREVAQGDPRFWSSLKLEHIGIRRITKEWLWRAGIHVEAMGPLSAFAPSQYLPPKRINLTSFSSIYFIPEECMEIFRRVPGLIHAEFRELEVTTFSNPMAPLQHSMLQSLVLRAGAYIPYNLDSLPLLQVLTLPALQTLDVGWAYLPSDAALFPAFLEKSPAIKHLTAALCQSKDPDTFPPIVTEPRGVVPALRKLPALTTLCLELENHEVMFDIVSRLRDQLFLRRLESISFSIALLRSGWHIPLNITTVFGHIHTALILEALTSRSGGPRSSAVQLREFAFTWPQGMWDPEALEQLHDSVQALQARSAVRVHLSEVVPRFAY